MDLHSQDINSFTDFQNYDNSTTLKLISYIHDDYDCGEWGGHVEKIVIYKFKDALTIIYSREKTNCPKELAGEKKLPSAIRTNWTDTLRITDWQVVKEYLIGLSKHKPAPDIISNASNSYEVQFTKDYFTSSFKVDDRDNSWKKYYEFRDYFVNKQH
ncbi:MAG: hypothetical protein JST26_13455 [Bacteroidetes bacterium]|nr:hypothetical protein [Bacteroidota bacterium]